MKPGCIACVVLIMTAWTSVFALPVHAQPSEPRAQAPAIPVRNYDECVKAGYPMGKDAGQEQCWIPNGFRIFVKGLKPSIHQGIYGTVRLRSGNCMPGIRFGDERDRIPRPNPCTVVTVDRILYIMEPIEARDRYDGHYLSPDLPPLKIAKSVNGIFEIDLQIGRYQLCVEDKSKKSCSWLPFTIERDGLQEFNVEINHAVY